MAKQSKYPEYALFRVDPRAEHGIRILQVSDDYDTLRQTRDRMNAKGDKVKMLSAGSMYNSFRAAWKDFLSWR